MDHTGAAVAELSVPTTASNPLVPDASPGSEAQSWIVVTARKGDKDKNRWTIAGHSLVAWVLKQTETTGITRVVTTDHGAIYQLAVTQPETIAIRRPPELSEGKPGQQAKAVLHALGNVGALPGDIVHLCQPTSPFIRGSDVERADEILRTRNNVLSVQTIVEVPHVFHENNQRYRFQEYVGFVHEDLRKAQANKQGKSQRWAFGNLVSTRLGELNYDGWFFSQPSFAIPIDRYHALDVDVQADLMIAEAYVKHGLVSNPWIRTEYDI